MKASFIHAFFSIYRPFNAHAIHCCYHCGKPPPFGQASGRPAGRTASRAAGSGRSGQAIAFRTMLIFTDWLNMNGSFKYKIYDSGFH